MPKALLIINPISGTRKKDHIAHLLDKALAPYGFFTESVETQCAGHAKIIAAKAAADDVELVAVAGGDGTVNEVASALCGTNTALGIIPCGSGNGLARTLGIPQNFEKAIEIISHRHSLKCDHGTINGLPFFCTCGVGLDAAVTEKFASMKRRGRMSYIKSLLEEVLNYSPAVYGLEINGKIITRRALLIAVCNTPQYGNNAYIAPQAKIDDGLLDVTVVHQGNPISTALMGLDMLTGYLNRNTLIETFRTDSAIISRLEDGAVQIDGEPFSLGKRLDIQCHKESINLIGIPNKPEFKPIISPFVSMIDDARNDLLTLFNNGI